MFSNKDYVRDHFKDLGDRSLNNRCLYCNVGMILETVMHRYCPKCGYTDISNVPLKVRLAFSIFEDLKDFSKGVIVVVAKEVDTHQVSFIKTFNSKSSAEHYLDNIKTVCLRQ